MLAGAFALAGCDDATTEIPGTTAEPGAAIERFEPVYDGITPSGFSITSSSAAIVSTVPVDTGQTPEYAVNRTTAVPTSRWQRALTFENLDSDTTYYVFARAGARNTDTVNYAAGEATRAQETVKTNPEGEVTSISTSWDPGPAYNAGGTSFTITAATPASNYPASQPVEYVLTTSNDRSSLTASTNWQTSRSFSLSRVSATTQNYLWARTQASGGEPEGIPLAKAIELPGPRLSGSFTAQEGTATATGASFTITSAVGLVKTPNIERLVIEYGLGTSALSPPGDGSAWGVPNASGLVTVSGLSADTPYYLWARAKSAPNYRSGEALMYSNAPFLRTSTSTSSANALVDALNRAIPSPTPPPGTGMNASLLGNTVTLLRSVTLDRDIDIPDGVILAINNNITLDAKGFRIVGSGKISLHGTLESGPWIRVTVEVYDDATYTSIGRMSIIKKTATPTGDLQLESGGMITVKHNDGWDDYTLVVGKATGTKVTLGYRDVFTITQGAIFDAKFVSLAGRIEVQSRGKLILSDTSPFTNITNTTGQIVINPGAEFNIVNIDIFTVTNVVDGELLLDPTGRVVITKYGDTPRYTLYGRASIVAANKGIFASGSTAIFEVASDGTLTIPRTIELTKHGNLNIYGTLDFTATYGTENAGTLTIQDGALNVGGTVNLNSGAKLAIFGGATLNVGGNVNVASDASVNLSENSILRGGGNINVTAGKIYIPNDFAVMTSTTAIFNGKVIISGSGELYTTPPPPPPSPPPAQPFIGFGTNSTFRLTGTSPKIEVSTVEYLGIRYPVYTLSGGATLNDNVTIIGRLVVSSGATLTMNVKTLTLSSPIRALENSGTINGVGTGNSVITGSNGAWASGTKPTSTVTLTNVPWE